MRETGGGLWRHAWRAFGVGALTTQVTPLLFFPAAGRLPFADFGLMFAAWGAGIVGMILAATRWNRPPGRRWVVATWLAALGAPVLCIGVPGTYSMAGEGMERVFGGYDFLPLVASYLLAWAAIGALPVPSRWPWWSAAISSLAGVGLGVAFFYGTIGLEGSALGRWMEFDAEIWQMMMIIGIVWLIPATAACYAVALAWRRCERGPRR